MTTRCGLGVFRGGLCEKYFINRCTKIKGMNTDFFSWRSLREIFFETDFFIPQRTTKEAQKTQKEKSKVSLFKKIPINKIDGLGYGCNNGMLAFIPAFFCGSHYQDFL